MVVFYRLSIVTIGLSLTIRPQFAIECFPTLNRALGYFEAKWGEEEVGWCKLNFNTIWERCGAVVCKRNLVYIFCCLSTMNKHVSQTDRPRVGAVTLIGGIAIDRIVFHWRCCLVIHSTIACRHQDDIVCVEMYSSSVMTCNCRCNAEARCGHVAVWSCTFLQAAHLKGPLWASVHDRSTQGNDVMMTTINDVIFTAWCCA